MREGKYLDLVSNFTRSHKTGLTFDYLNKHTDKTVDLGYSVLRHVVSCSGKSLSVCVCVPVSVCVNACFRHISLFESASV